MEKMRMESLDMTTQNIEKIGALFPNCITETVDEEKSTAENKVYKKVINFDLLKQMLSDDVLEGNEAYEFTWVGKKAAIVEANKPIRKTLRPCKEDSVNWDTTENLYIEGDNLEVLKLLQESYLGSIKMIYIDPPYNTGKDSFMYPDDFSMDADEYDELIQLTDEDGNVRYRPNEMSNPRFHSSWCSMMYSRLLLARNLLSEDGFIFISIDDSEADNMRKICDEIFGASNYENTNYIQVRYAEKTLTADMNYHKQIEQVLVYRKSAKAKPYLQPMPYDYDKFIYSIEELSAGREIELGGKRVEVFEEGQYRIVKHDKGFSDGLKEIWATGTILNGNSSGRFFRDYLNNRKNIDGLGILYKVYDIGDDKYDYRYFTGPKKENATKGKYYQGVPTEKLAEGAVKTTPIPNFYDMAGDFGNIRLEGGVAFNSGKKPIKLLRHYLDYFKEKDFTVLDFFSGSASTAHAVMQMNSEDQGNRKFIMVQIQEPCQEGSDAYELGFKNICEIGKERIRRSGKKIVEDSPITTQNLDTGFRVFNRDESNMNDVYYSAEEYSQGMLSMLESNVKADRTDLDLLFGCLLEWGLPLSLPYTSETIEGCTVHTYNDGDLIACFDENIPDSVIKTIAKRQPLRAVFRDSSFANSPSKINVGEVFKLLAPDTRVKVI